MKLTIRKTRSLPNISKLGVLAELLADRFTLENSMNLEIVTPGQEVLTRIYQGQEPIEFDLDYRISEYLHRYSAIPDSWTYSPECTWSTETPDSWTVTPGGHVSVPGPLTESVEVGLTLTEPSGVEWKTKFLLAGKHKFGASLDPEIQALLTRYGWIQGEPPEEFLVDRGALEYWFSERLPGGQVKITGTPGQGDIEFDDGTLITF